MTTIRSLIENCDTDAVFEAALRMEKALNMACTIVNGRAHFITRNGIPMEMPKKAERIVRAALRGTP